jgi:MoxR-like ATPase
VLRHRVSLTPEMEIEGRGADSVIADLLATVEAPRL